MKRVVVVFVVVAALGGIAAVWLSQLYDEHERALLRYATERLTEIEGVRLIGTARDKHALVSFVMG